MKKILYILSLIITSLSFVSCEDVIEFNDKESAPMLITHVMATPDSTLYAQVTKSVFFLDITDDPFKDRDGNFLGVKDAVVRLYVNNVYKEDMTLISGDSGIYKATYIPKEYELIQVVVSSPSFEKIAEGKTTLPKAITITADTTLSYREDTGSSVTIIDSEVSYDTVTWKRTDFTIHITDNASEENYYGVAVLEDRIMYDTFMGFGTDSIDNSQYLVTEDKTIFNGRAEDPNILLFEDKKISGQAYDFKFYIEERVYSAEDSVLYHISTTPIKKRLKFYSFNKDAFLFMTSAKKNYESSGMSFFSEPSQVYTNVKNGIGIIGGFSVFVKEY